MIKTLRHILLAAGAALMLSSCLVHEFPEGIEEVDVAINLDFQDVITPYKTVSKALLKAADENCRVRYTLKAYEYAGDAFDKRARFTTVIFKEDASSPANTLHFVLPSGKYKILCWADYVYDDERTVFWEPADLGKVTLPEDYYGASDRRDAFRGELDIDITDFHATGMSSLHVMPMHRPLGKYVLVATDKQEFLTKNLTKAGYDFSTFTAVVDYQQFFPSAYSCFYDRATGSSTGISYDCTLVEKDNGEVEMAFDYVLLSEQESDIVLNITLFDAQGEDLGTVRNVKVPMKRNGLTTVRGSFLTKGTVSGISIDPGFAGDHNVNI